MGEVVRWRADGLDVAALAWGPPDGRLALCLHGYPDTAHTWRHLGPVLAADGFRVVAPFQRGYAPTALAPDGDYSVGALARDADAARDALGGDDRAVLIGHDWGAVAAYAARGRWARVVALAVPPVPVLLRNRDPLAALDQLRRSWYMLFQQVPGLAERRLPGLAARLWADWSPGYDAGDDLAHLAAALPTDAHRSAALRYYRALPRSWGDAMRVPAVATLYLHGAQDGCVRPGLGGDPTAVLPPGSEAATLPGVGHFLHLEDPDTVNARIRAFLADD